MLTALAELQRNCSRWIAISTLIKFFHTQLKSSYCFRSEQKSSPHLAYKYGMVTEIIIAMTNNRACERPTSSYVVDNSTNIQVPGQKVDYQNFEAMRESLLKNVEGDSILLDYLSNLDVHEQMVPVAIDQFINTFKNLVVKQQLANSDDDAQGFNFDPPWLKPVVSMLNPNLEAVKFVSTFCDLLNEVSEKVRKEKQKIKKRK